MKRFSVIVGVMVTDARRQKFTVLADNIVAAQIRVMKRIRGITGCGMFEIRSAWQVKDA